MSRQLVAVVGSANLDLTARVSDLPRPGQTLLASGYEELVGGKGLNQVLAAARVGDAALVAAVGDDAAGERLREAARSRGVDVEDVATVPEPTGRALIAVDEQGENQIVVVPGANATLTPARVVSALDRLEPAVVLVQSEIPAEAEQAALRWAAEHEARALWNLSPVRSVDADLLARADPLVVNEGEVQAIAEGQGVDVDTLVTRCRSVVVTRGADGATWWADGTTGQVPAPTPDRVVDTVGAGDEAAGALAAALANGRSLADAVTEAMAAASRVVGIDRSSR